MKKGLLILGFVCSQAAGAAAAQGTFVQEFAQRQQQALAPLIQYCLDEYNDRRDQAQERVDLGDRLDAVERRIRIKDSCQGVDESEAVRKQVDDRCQCRNKQYDQSCFQR